MENKIIKFVPNDVKETKTTSYIEARQRDIQAIKILWAKTKQVEFSKTDHWIKVGGIVFNGFTREHFEKIVGIKEE